MLDSYSDKMSDPYLHLYTDFRNTSTVVFSIIQIHIFLSEIQYLQNEQTLTQTSIRTILHL